MMSKEKRRVPKLRFPGFTEDWEQRKLGNIVDFLDGQRKPLKESERTKGKYPYYGASGIIDYINDYLFDENLVLLSEDGANIIDRNYPVCFIATGKYWVNNHAHVLKVKTGVIDKFICESLERLDYTKFNTGTAQPKLNQDICQKIVITIPNEDEQKCISEFLDRINNIITLHQRKLDNLKLKKKALLQKLFPKNGERYPELRFPGFTDAWEQRKLGNIVDFLDGQRKPLKESERTKGKYPYYGASGIIDYINDYLFDENLVLLSEDGANIIDRNYPVCFIATGKYWVNNHAHVLKVKTGVIDKFICESLERLDYTKFNTGTAQPKLNQDICQKIVITIPNEDEQKCISEFLDRINNIITLHQRKLNHLQLQKKALLQQMFV